MRGLAVLALLSLALGCASTTPGGGDPRAITSMASLGSSCEPRVLDRLFFGLSTPSGQLSEADWQAFVDAFVTPRFPEGLTIVAASGQWRGKGSDVVREPSRVVEIIHSDSREASASVSAIVAEYKTRYKQESVLVVRSVVSACF